MKSRDGVCPLCWVPKENIWWSRRSTWSTSILTTANIYSTVADEVEVGWEGIVPRSNVFGYRGTGTGGGLWGARWEAVDAVSSCPIGVVGFEIVSDFRQDP